MVTLSIILILITIYGNYLTWKHRGIKTYGFLPFEQLADHIGWVKTLMMVTALIIDSFIVFGFIIGLIILIIKYLP